MASSNSRCGVAITLVAAMLAIVGCGGEELGPCEGDVAILISNTSGMAVAISARAPHGANAQCAYDETIAADAVDVSIGDATLPAATPLVVIVSDADSGAELFRRTCTVNAVGADQGFVAAEIIGGGTVLCHCGFTSSMGTPLPC